MLIGQKEREVLFGTSVLARQIQKFIEAKRETGLDALLKVFPDIRREILVETLRQLRIRGVISHSEGVYIATYKYKVEGAKADQTWSAAKILGTFDPSDLARIASVERIHAATLCRTWLREGHLVCIGRKGKVPLYRFCSKFSNRPIIHQERKK
ncbi:hypothetical protein [Parasphaerochaeta coccoides]|uniref:Uncharacterized protein n=1 Tax=Parasphaerochaeta coccoides (strain ATCC BAA-1237 / DSM 17374 / SPN1) TaxID=760011 RepID=F4GHU6_PARC1|nr:hypothetical protein [Parasphaerochaeta coccoides]AEC02059.1 hypothetical protein Spico_0835 [Parasphaerochaeta coccoides DSM 17374]